jgi:acyl-CoA synthetase (AMP-forming)/AMP-acid ligase II
MAYQKHRNIIGHFSPANTLCDELACMQYVDIPLVLSQIDVFFRKHTQGPVFCVGLPVQNNLVQAMVILYLLSEKINFFLLSGNSNHQQMPLFCDKILTVTGNYQPGIDVQQALALTGHEGCVAKERAIRPGSGAVFFSSSGTSGPAKYVYFKQEKLIQNARNCIQRFGFDQESKILVPVPIGHAYGMGVGLLPGLVAGANLCLVEKNNIVKLFAMLGSFRPNYTLINPTVCKMILLLDKPISSKTMYITAGEKMDENIHREFEAKYGLLVNLFGCSELGAVATSPVDEASAEDRLEGFVQPVEGVEVVIDKENKGEIVCRHNAGFEHYVDRYGDTDTSFNTDNSLFNTRDRGLDAGNGNFKVMGRIDNCVNRAGFLISLEEIESSLKELFAGLKQVVVFEASAQESLLTRLVAVCEVADRFELDEAEVSSICRKKMKRYFLPDEFHFVQDMPRLGNGKPDRSFLKNNYKNIIKN